THCRVKAAPPALYEGGAGSGAVEAAPAVKPSGFVCLLEAIELVVARLGGGGQCFLGRLLAGPDLLGFLVDDGANLVVVANADAARLVGSLANHLRHGHIGARLFLV